MRVSLKRLLGVGLLFLVPSAAFATAVLAQTFEEMVKASPLIVHATVGQVQPQWDSHGHIQTIAEITVAETLKGSSPKQLLVKQPGGVIGERGTSVAGAAQFSTGAQCVLFLEPAVDEPSIFIVSRMAAGKVDLETRAGELHAIRHHEGLAFIDSKTGRVADLHPIGSGGVEDLGSAEEYLAHVRAVVKVGGR